MTIIHGNTSIRPAQWTATGHRVGHMPPRRSTATTAWAARHRIFAAAAWLSNDHTGGPATGPAQVADNDLATGKVVDEISHSKYWKDSAIFVVEDDSQGWVDHVDGHRAPIQIISPWAQHGTVDTPLLLTDHDDPDHRADPRDPPDEP